MGIVADLVYFALLVFLLLLLFRLVMEYVFLLARSYTPAGPVAAVLELAYSVTDPPLKALRKVIPPLRPPRTPTGSRRCTRAPTTRRAPSASTSATAHR